MQPVQRRVKPVSQPHHRSGIGESQAVCQVGADNHPFMVQKLIFESEIVQNILFVKRSRRCAPRKCFKTPRHETMEILATARTI
ncbi:MAG: hypothetical protein ACI87E_004341 [Mariniblastus sp.]|jgi:hypothetical protein